MISPYCSHQKRLRVYTLVSLAVLALASCSRGAALDLQPEFQKLQSGQSLDEVREVLHQPLATPSMQREALGFQYMEFKLVDTHSTYELTFMALPGRTPLLASKKSNAHAP